MLPLIVHTVTDSVYWTKANSVLIETLLSPLSLSMIEGIKDLKRGDASVDSFRTSCCSVQRLDLSNLCVCVYVTPSLSCCGESAGRPEEVITFGWSHNGFLLH